MEALGFLQQKLSSGLLNAGIPIDTRPFRAHITLGREIRVHGPVGMDEIKITIPVNRISLMKSEHSGGQLVYTEVFGNDLL
jgi:2'-5' RNA ligase